MTPDYGSGTEDSTIDTTITSSSIFIVPSSFSSVQSSTYIITESTASTSIDTTDITTTTTTTTTTITDTTESTTTTATTVTIADTTITTGISTSTTTTAITTEITTSTTTTAITTGIPTSTTTTVITTGIPTSTTTSPATTPYPNFCKNSTHFLNPYVCSIRENVKNDALDILRNNSSNATAIGNALISYIEATSNLDTTSTSNNLTINEIDEYVSNLDNVNLSLSRPTSFIMAQPPNPSNVIILGASFTRGEGGKVVDNKNINDVTNSSISTAAIVSNDSLNNVKSINILIIDDPTPYKNIDNKSNATVTSSIIVITLRRNNNNSPTKTNVSLYFRLLNDSTPMTNVTYLCSFYDNITTRWNDFGCTPPDYNTPLNRFECNCNHTTTFALIWLPKAEQTPYLTAQDIASLVFQSISILCFLAIIIHGLAIRICNPFESIQARHLLPLISCAVTMILFIFWIALTMTVYTKKPSSNEIRCFLPSNVLMFFTYFFLIFMFCVKTSVGYFNYLRFVHLFPEPSCRKLFVMLLISFFISITWVSFAAGFNSNPSLNITIIYPKMCWFSRDVLYYFLTIPACLFILINIIIFLLVAKRMIEHVRNSTSPHQTYHRMKICVLVLLSSCFTQGIGWLFGPSITFLQDENAANILGWFFIIFNGLEGFWAVILYIIIRLQHTDEQKRVMVSKHLTASTPISFIDSDKYYKNDFRHNLERRREWPLFHDLSSIDNDGRWTSTC